SLDESPAARRVIDLGGRTVIPGLIDAHVHLLAFGRLRRELDLTGVTSYDEVVRRVRDRARTQPAGTWITGSGYDLAEHPHHAALSAATPDHPVWLIRKDAHSGIANSRAMALADLGSVPAGGVLLRDQGVFLENAQSMIAPLVPHEAPETALLGAQKEAMQLGLTGIHDAMADDDTLRALRSLDAGRSLRLRVHAMYWNGDPDRTIEFMRSHPPVREGRLRVRAVKLFMDGSLGSQTAWMLHPPEGVPRLRAADVERIGRVALETGYQMCVHAIGDRANRELLEAYERLDPPAEARWRIEHAQHVDPADFPRFGRFIASVQPSHCVADRKRIEENLGPSRYEGSYAWKRLGRLALGTDAPVESLDPRWTFYCAVTRDGWRTGDCLSPEEALRGMTADAAHAGFMEGGVLSPGRPADMVVLSHDWLTVPPREMLASEVLATLMDGRVGFMSRTFG
ncbi:MAG TPA: amidohydrolase, partial [Planctomycetota bacterium]|nr:amidohydrolase [Planctomycetota bacterium]